MGKIKMQIFGNFSLSYGGKTLEEEEIRSNKIVRMLVYLLMNRENPLPRQRLIEAMWDDDTKNPEGALKNLMYRIRNVLKQLGDEEFVCTAQSGYRWNPEIEVETDYEELERLGAYLETEKELSLEEKYDIYTKILNCYKNNVTSALTTESWMLSKIAWYQSVYVNAGKHLCQLLEDAEDWGRLERVCNDILEGEPFDEDFHGWLLLSLYGQNKYDQALVQYEKSKKSLYENMGISSSEKLCQIFDEKMAEISGKTTNIAKLLEETKEQEKPKGVFFCDYQIFRQIYRMEIRRMDRIGLAEHVMLLTLRKKSSDSPGGVVDAVLKEGMDVLEQSIRTSLRTGDMASRYSQTQFIVLLPMCTYESGLKVAKRIQKNFRENCSRRGLELVFELAAATPD